MGKFKFDKNVYTRVARIPQDWDVLEIHALVEKQKSLKAGDVQLLPGIDEEQGESNVSSVQAA